MSKPNPPPSETALQEISGVENASNGFLRPLAIGFTFTPTIVESVASFVRLALPPAYDTVSGTCAERISFHALALVGCLLTLFELALLPNHKLVKTGPYAYIRHPSYMGGLLALAGMTMANVSRGAWANECGFAFPWWGIGWGIVVGVSTFVIIDRCPREDRILHEAFGEEWEVWRMRVRWHLLPGIF